MTAVKICGLSEPQTLRTAIQCGARFVGFVFYPPSPRNVSLDTAATLARTVPTGVRSVGLFVNPDDKTLNSAMGTIPLDTIQLHGDETPDRIKEIKKQHPTQIIKAIRIGSPDDLQNLAAFESAADWILFDARPPHADLPGGTGETFDWSILQDVKMTKPWMLSGGLTTDNIAEALSILKPDAVDVSSGVESTRGIKDAKKIKTFIDAVKNA